MPISLYPAAYDIALEIDRVNNSLTANDHAGQHNVLSDAVMAIEHALGLNPQGSYASVVARFADLVNVQPGADQIITPQGDFVGLSVRASNLQNTHNLIDVRNSSGTIIGWWDRLGRLSANSLLISGAALASTHLSDTSLLARLASPALTGTPTAPTASGGVNSTQIATTAYVTTAVAAATPGPASISQTQLAKPSVGTPELQDSSVTSAKIANSTIATVDIANAAITSALIAANAVGSTQIANGSVTAAKLGYLVEHGAVSLTGMSPFAGAVASVVVTFGTAYASAPTVVVGFTDPSLSDISAWAESVTTSGFTLKGIYTGGGAVDATATGTWVAVGSA